jgi:hypothetical protein
MGRNIASTRAYRKKSSTSTRVAISTKVGIKTNSSKDAFGLS